jgi:hypothetical protein
MNPETAKKLMTDIQEFRDFISFLSSKALELNNLSDITLTDPVALSVEVKARQKAYDKIIEILHPLINSDTHDKGGSIKNSDFII